MYAISNNYKNLIENSLSLSPKSKIVVDNIEYTGNVLKTYPKISHKNSSMIGGFPSKTCSFEIYDFDNNLDFEGKEITVYRGLDVDGTIEWISQGIFIPTADKITTNISTKTISFDNIQDKSQFFDLRYESDLNWAGDATYTGLEIVQEICTKLNINLETTNFNWYNYSFKQPNFSSNITYREVISRIAEIGGNIAYMSRTGGLLIKGQMSTGYSIARKRYNKLSKEKQYGPINVVVLGKNSINDDIVYPNNLPTEKIEWKILDNPFVDLYREEMIENVANYIIGKSITPFTLNDFVDGFYLDLNDTIQVTDKNNNIFNATILNYESTSRIKSNVSADVQNNNVTNYNLAGSNKKTTLDVKADVDHIKGQVDLVVKEQTEQSEKIAQLQIDNENITATTSSIQNNLETNYYDITKVDELIQNAETGLTNTFLKSGGSNLLRNTAPFFMSSENEAEYWQGNVKQMKEVNSASGFALLIQNGTLSQTIDLAPNQYAIKFHYKRLLLAATATVKYNGRTIELEEEGTIETTGTVNSGKFEFRVDCNIDDGYEIYDLMLNVGSIVTTWTQNANESTSDTVNISKGITVDSNTTNTKAKMDSDGFRVTNKSTGESVMEGTDEGGKFKKVEAEKGTIGGVIIQNVGNQSWISGV